VSNHQHASHENNTWSTVAFLFFSTVAFLFFSTVALLFFSTVALLFSPTSLFRSRNGVVADGSRARLERRGE
jgi:RsiW-degrading membrane proteinase PrsW (M82 family)